MRRLDQQLARIGTACICALLFSTRTKWILSAPAFSTKRYCRGSAATLTTHSVNLSLGETHVFSPRILNEVPIRLAGRFGRPGRSQRGQRFRPSIRPRREPRRISATSAFHKFRSATRSRTIGDPTGSSTRTDRDFEFYDNASVQRGSHTLQFGAYFFHLDFNPSYPNDARGVYTYSGVYTATLWRTSCWDIRRRRKLESARVRRTRTLVGRTSMSRMAGG